jgi:hypothetical protein
MLVDSNIQGPHQYSMRTQWTDLYAMHINPEVSQFFGYFGQN